MALKFGCHSFFCYFCNMNYELCTILGPTACGKTTLAVALAQHLHGEIISGDSRQVYRGMDLGTGKDLNEYNGIPYHLIDIIDAGEKYNLFDFQHDFLQVYNEIKSRGVFPVFCGGSGLYLESILRSYRLFDVPQNEKLRQQLSNKSLPELTKILSSFKTLHNTTDVDTAKRAIRAIEIETYYQNISKEARSFPSINSLNIGVDIPRDLRRQRITERLRQRLADGMVDEINSLINKGVSPESLIYYGLEYKFITQYIIGQLTYDEMFSQLEIAIHQFAKRQMTWFRGMERRGIKIHWIDATLTTKEKVQQIISLLKD